MKRILLYISLLFCTRLAAQGLYVNGPNASLIVGENSFISIDGTFQNQDCDPVAQVRVAGQLYVSKDFITNDVIKFFPTNVNKKCKLSLCRFASSFPGNITGSVTPQLYELEIDKGLGQRVDMFNDIVCLDTVYFKSGFLYPRQRKVILQDPAGAPTIINHPWIKNERNGSQFMANLATDTGMVYYQTVYTNSLNFNPANIGILINGLVNQGSPVLVKRGYRQQQYSANGSIAKYFDIISPNHSLSGNTLQMNYLLNDQYNFPINMSNLTAYTSSRQDMYWSPMRSAAEVVTLAQSFTAAAIFTMNLSDFRLPGMTTDSLAFRITLAEKDCQVPVYSYMVLDSVRMCPGTSRIMDVGYGPVIPNTPLRFFWNTIPPQYTQTISVSPQSTNKKINVTITDVRGCITRDSIVVTPPAPAPQITYLNHLNACMGDSVIIKDTVKITSGIFVNEWIFSNGDTIYTNQKYFKRYFAPGTYSVILTSATPYGCTTTASIQNIRVYSPPTASFTSGLNCILGAISFTNLSVSNEPSVSIANSDWNFGLGATATSTLLSPSYSYTAPGTYTVKLHVTTNADCKDTIALPVTVYPRNKALLSKNNVCLGDTVNFSNLSLCNTGNCQYQWSFGDNTFSNLFAQKKKYQNPGLYTVKLKVSNANTCPDSVLTNVFVNVLPVASFSLSANSVCPNEMVYATNTSTIASGSISSYTWLVSGSLAGNGINLSKSFSGSGFTPFRLIARSDSGCTRHFDDDITVFQQPTSQFSVQNACLTDSATFVSTSGPGLQHQYYFGNTFDSGTTTATHKYNYPAAGSYTTSLIVTSSDGCRDTSYAPLTIFAMPQMAISGSLATCGESYTLDALNSDCTFLWSPGNETSQNKYLTSTGNYQVVVTTTDNCTSTQSTYIVLHATVKPDLGADTSACGKLLLNAGYPGSLFNWNNVSGNQLHLVDSTGWYHVLVTDQNNCSGADSIFVTILSSPTVSLGNDVQSCLLNGVITLTSAVAGSNNLIWNTGSNQNSISVSSSGHYWLEAISGNGCSDRDSVFVTVKNTPVVNLGPDRSACGSIYLDAFNAGKTFNWSNGENGQNISTSSGGKFWVTVTDPLSLCSAADTVILEVFPNVTVNLGPDTTACRGQNIVLNSRFTGDDYQFNWTNSAATSSVQVTETAVYGVTVTSPEGCSGSDFKTVTFLESPKLSIGKRTRYLCGDAPLLVQGLADAPVIWSGVTGTLDASSTGVYLREPGKYWAMADNGTCQTTDTLLLQRSTLTVSAQYLASTVDTLNREIKFVNLSYPDTVSSLWNFGDGVTSAEKDPTHAFILPGNFKVTLEVSNGYCTDKTSKGLNVLLKSLQADSRSSAALEFLSCAIYPNPTSSQVFIHIETNHANTLHLRLTDLSGRLVAEHVEKNDGFARPVILMDEFAQGLYTLHLQASSERGNISKSFKLVKTQ